MRPTPSTLILRATGYLFCGMTILGQPAHAEFEISATRVASGLSRPIYATSPPNDTDRLFIAEQHTGRVRILNLADNSLNPTPFLDLSGLSTGNEQGLLGLTFDPDYATNGHFYVNFTDTTRDTHVRRYTVSANPDVADASSGVEIMRFDQPESNHNGGWMGFGPDDYLYIATGDGGSGNDPHGPIGNSQDITNNPLGKILRVDPSSDAFPADSSRHYSNPPSNPFVGATGDDEIWSYGLRNPWRASFDRETGDFYIADVGQNAREEVNFQPANSPGGENYGWRLREGTIATPTGGVGGNPPPGNVEPIHDYFHALGRVSTTGGYVYRGPIEAMQGHYFFADFVSSEIWSLRYDGTKRDFSNNTDRISTDIGGIQSIASFAEDADGNLYVVSLNGSIYRFDNAVELPSLVPRGSTWRYLDDGSDQGTDWRQPQFNDANWDSGPAQLGYGDDGNLGGDEQTTISFGPNSNDKFATTYFRHAFDITDNPVVEELTLSLLRDDGAAVFLNGVEVVRTSNLAPNAGFDDYANFNNQPAISGNAEDTFETFDIDPNLLVEGENVFAVEVHQQSGTSSDMSFDLGLTARVLPTLGDYDKDGMLTTADINELGERIRNGENSNTLDINDDGVVNHLDHQFWVTDVFGTLLGDADLNGTVDDTDFATWQANLFTAGTSWDTGDFNGDGTTDVQDFNLWNAHKGMTAPAGVAVPEPATAAMWLSSWMGVLAVRRRMR